MSFTGKQQGIFRPMVNVAWQAAVRMHPALTRCKGKRCGRCDFCLWYEDELEAVTGSRSSTDLDVKRDFENVMGHFEEWGGEGIYWQRRRDNGDARRVLHEVRKLCGDFEVSESYMQAIARRELKLGASAPLPQLSSLSYEALANVRSALKRDVRSQLRAGRKPHLPVARDECLVKPESDDPF